MRKPAPLRLDSTYNGNEGGMKETEWSPGRREGTGRGGWRGGREREAGRRVVLWPNPVLRRASRRRSWPRRLVHWRCHVHALSLFSPCPLPVFALLAVASLRCSSSFSNQITSSPSQHLNCRIRPPSILWLLASKSAFTSYDLNPPLLPLLLLQHHRFILGVRFWFFFLHGLDTHNSFHHQAPRQV